MKSDPGRREQAQETCKKDQFCYSPDDGKDKCLDEQKTDPYLIDVYLVCVGFIKLLAWYLLGSGAASVVSGHGS